MQEIKIKRGVDYGYCDVAIIDFNKNRIVKKYDSRFNLSENVMGLALMHELQLQSLLSRSEQNIEEMKG